jgi:tetratricopeptide (TPR) repeat protein
MTPVSPSALEGRTRAFLTEVLMNVPIGRAQGTPEEYLDILERAVLFHPVFQGWPTPMNGWLTEAEELSRDLERLDSLATVMLRRAVVHMRRLEYDAAHAELDRLRTTIPQLTPAHRAWDAVTRARLLTREQQFDAARAALQTIASPPQDSWVAALPIIARGELQVETNEIAAAEATLQRALAIAPFELVEERVQVLQALGFVAISQANAPKALDRLDEARQIVRGAGVWSEVIQMNLAVGGFQVAAGHQDVAQALFAEGLELCRQHPQPQFETLLRIALARSKAAEGRIEEAVGAVVQAATLFARQRNVVGYVSMIVLMANLYIDQADYAEGYRILATGVAIARQRHWPAVENVLRVHINRLRNDTMGAERFDAMVQGMIDQVRQDDTNP